jgi:hypothetical protein
MSTFFSSLLKIRSREGFRNLLKNPYTPKSISKSSSICDELAKKRKTLSKIRSNRLYILFS